VLIGLFSRVLRLRRYERTLTGMEIGVFEAGWSISGKCSHSKGSPPRTTFACIDSPVNALQLCIRLSSSEVKCVLRFGAPFGELRGRYDVHLRLTEKRVALPGVMAKALRANINL